MTGDWAGHDIDDLAERLCHDAHLAPPAQRIPIRVWALSGVERVHLADHRTAILKYAKEPFTSEDTTLTACQRAGLPVPAVLATCHQNSILVMLLEDLGEPVREATDGDAARIAVLLHHQQDLSLLPPLTHLSEADLAMLPDSALAALHHLRENARRDVPEGLTTLLVAIADAAPDRAAGANLAPFGLVHGELHPTSVHVGARGPHVLDLAKAFIGPGLLDIATWYGTRRPPDIGRMQSQLHAYVGAGGHTDALASRGGLPPAGWALGWHRLWAAHWLLDQAARGQNSVEPAATLFATVRRQLAAARELLGV